MYNHHFSNFGRPPVPDDLCKYSATRHPRFWRSRFLKVFTTYRHGGHLGQWMVTILASEKKSFEILNVFSIQMYVATTKA